MSAAVANAEPNQAAIELRAVSKSFDGGATQAVRSVDLAVRALMDTLRRQAERVRALMQEQSDG